MDFAFTEDQKTIREAVLQHCSQFGDEYWLEHDRTGDFPEEFYRSMAGEKDAEARAEAAQPSRRG